MCLSDTAVHSGLKMLAMSVQDRYRGHQDSKVPKDLPVFMVSGADDPVGDLGEGVKKVYHMFKEAGVDDLTYRLYETDRHEILNETDRDQVYADICAWMSVRLE